ncbi:MAG TPA: DUF885 domain-containing protein [Steroidobacteraceae bacterium]|nr:DUF885 domain-containing protein [Steroidobacteraceae bacterium]
MIDARQKTLHFIASFAVATAGFPAAAGADTPDANAVANAFFERALDERLAMEPTLASVLGLKIGYDRWSDPTERADNERKALSERQLAELRTTIDPAALDDTTRLSWQVFESSEERRIARHRWRNHNYRFDKNGSHVSMPAFLINTHRVESDADAVAYIRRLEGIRTQLDQQLERAALAAKQGILPPRFVFPYVIEDSRNIVTGRPFDDGPADSPLFADFKSKVEKLAIEEARRESLLAQAELALLTSVNPGYEAVIAWAGEAAKMATDDDGIWKLPDGPGYYDYLLENFTTTKLSADEIHAIGLREVARLHGDMRKVMKQVEFEGDLPAFFEFMRTDPRFYYEDSDAGRAAWHADANRFIAGMRAKLPELFITLPKSEVVVKAVEPFREKSAGKAFYQRPSLDGTRPGVFYGNLYQMNEMPKYELEALVYHEAIPGHHMQIAIATEEESLPRFRRLGGYTAYSEGWGLYSERLGKELGFYSDPWSEFGRLALELHRAVRLVVDTGLHAKRWTREQTIRYHVENSPTGEDAAIRATERYILNPGQATAYMIGMLKIVELREHAATALGPRFDRREFHDLVLRTGAVPLIVLEAEVQRWVDRQQS